ncbi:hypothetical protein FF38_01692 [Lucilia cuprina]|uniref:Uncharacterized protein n=1 Tax=Lucilia cuprina TaxID=7375 RepID=A0A0L0CKT3_LUCCU|nr:hypothetical protein FF38_01692 [Lucilia cuprina]
MLCFSERSMLKNIDIMQIILKFGCMMLKNTTKGCMLFDGRMDIRMLSHDPTWSTNVLKAGVIHLIHLHSSGIKQTSILTNIRTHTGTPTVTPILMWIYLIHTDVCNKIQMYENILRPGSFEGLKCWSIKRDEITRKRFLTNLGNMAKTRICYNDHCHNPHD